MSRKILLTGCTRGLGRALVNRFVEEGHQVAGCGRTEELIEELKECYSGTHHFHALDITDSAAVESWAQELFAAGFVPDLLINNAGTINRNAYLWEVPAEEFDQVIDVNIKGLNNVLRAFLPEMVHVKQGVIVNLSGGWGRAVSGEVAPYCATKWAVEGLTKALAEELPPGMAAIPMNPGVINTAMLQSCYGPSSERYPDAEEWSRRAAPFFLSLNENDNGHSLSV